MRIGVWFNFRHFPEQSKCVALEESACGTNLDIQILAYFLEIQYYCLKETRHANSWSKTLLTFPSNKYVN